MHEVINAIREWNFLGWYNFYERYAN
jgi:hypothetical protein